MDLDIQFSPFPLGHEIRNIDVRHLDDESFAKVEAAFDRYGVIVIRGQSLTPQDQVDFSKRFGPLDRFVLERFNMPDLPEVFVLSNIIDETGKPVGMNDAGRYWHSDMWITERPPRGSMLYAVEVPHGDDGRPLGDTYFASTADAYDTLPDDLKAKIENLSAVFSSRKYMQFVGHDKPKDVHTKAIMEAQEEVKDVQITHRMVRRHPRTGRKCLYVVEGVITHIVGMEPDESQALLDRLMKHIIRTEAVYHHHWKVGDIVMWDNYSAVHCAIGNFELPQRRLMHRTTLALQGAGTGAAAAARAASSVGM